MAAIIPTNALNSHMRDGCFTCGAHTTLQRKRLVTVKAARWGVEDAMINIRSFLKKQNDGVKSAFVGLTAMQQSSPSIPMPPTFKYLSRDVVVLIDPQHNRLVYLVGVDVAASSADRVAEQLRALQQAAGARYLHLMDLPGHLRRVILRKFPGGYPTISQVPLPHHLASAGDDSSDADTTGVQHEPQRPQRSGVLGLLYGDMDPNDAEDADGVTAAEMYGNDNESYRDCETPDMSDDVRSRRKKMRHYMGWLKGTSPRVSLLRDSHTQYKMQWLVETMNEFGVDTAFMPSPDLMYTRNYIHEAMKDEFEYANYLHRKEITQEYEDWRALMTLLREHEEETDDEGGTKQQGRKRKKGKGRSGADGDEVKEGGVLLVGRAAGGGDDEGDGEEEGLEEEEEEEEEGVRVADVFQRLLAASGRKAKDSDEDDDNEEEEEEGVVVMTLDGDDAKEITELLQSLRILTGDDSDEEDEEEPAEEEEVEEEEEEEGEGGQDAAQLGAVDNKDNDRDRKVAAETADVIIGSRLRRWMGLARNQEAEESATSAAASGPDSSTSRSSNTGSSTSSGPELLASDFFLRREPASVVVPFLRLQGMTAGGEAAASLESAVFPMQPRGVWTQVSDGPMGWTLSIRTAHEEQGLGGGGGSGGDSSSGVTDMFDAFDEFLTELKSSDTSSSKSAVDQLEAAWRLHSPPEPTGGREPAPPTRSRNPDPSAASSIKSSTQQHSTADDDDGPLTAEVHRPMAEGDTEPGSATAAVESDSGTAAVRPGSSRLDSFEEDWRQAEGGRTAAGSSAATTTGAAAVTWGVPADRLLRPARRPAGLREGPPAASPSSPVPSTSSTLNAAPSPSTSDSAASTSPYSPHGDSHVGTGQQTTPGSIAAGATPLEPHGGAAAGAAAGVDGAATTGNRSHDVDQSLVTSTRLRREAIAAARARRSSSSSGISSGSSTGATHASKDASSCSTSSGSSSGELSTAAGEASSAAAAAAAAASPRSGLPSRNGAADGGPNGGSGAAPKQGPPPAIRRGRARMVRRPRRLLLRSAEAEAEGPGEGPSAAVTGGAGSGGNMLPGEVAAATSASAGADGAPLDGAVREGASAAADGANGLGIGAEGALDVPIPAYKQHRKPLLSSHPADGVTAAAAAAAAGLGLHKEPHPAGAGKGALGRPGGLPPSTSGPSMPTGAGAVRPDGMRPTANPAPEATARHLDTDRNPQQLKVPGGPEQQPQPQAPGDAMRAAAAASELSRRIPPTSKAPPTPSHVSKPPVPPEVILSQSGDAVHLATPRRQVPRVRWQRHGAPSPLPRDLFPRYVTGYGRITQRRYRKLRLPFGLTRLLLPAHMRMSPSPAVMRALKSLIDSGDHEGSEAHRASPIVAHTDKEQEQGLASSSKRGLEAKRIGGLAGWDPNRHGSGPLSSCVATDGGILAAEGSKQPASRTGGFLDNLVRLASTVVSRLGRRTDTTAATTAATESLPPPLPPVVMGGAESAASSAVQPPPFSHSGTALDEGDMVLQALDDAPPLVRQRAEALVSYLRGRAPPTTDGDTPSAGGRGRSRLRTGLPGLARGRDAVVLMPLELLQPTVGLWQAEEERLMHPDVSRRVR